MSEQVPMPTTMEEIQRLLDREDNSFTRTIVVELPRMVHDGDPRCAMLFAGPDAYYMLQILTNVVEQLATRAAEARVNAPASTKLQ